MYGWEIEFLAHAIEQANTDIEYLTLKATQKSLTIYETKTLLSAEHFMYRVIGISPEHLKRMRNKYAKPESEEENILQLNLTMCS